MRRAATVLGVLAIVAVVVYFGGCGRASRRTGSGAGKGCSWSVYFSPNGGATDAVVRAVNSARKTVLVQAYSFTSAPIAQALDNAHNLGVDVRILLDKSNAGRSHSEVDNVAGAGIPVKIDYAHAIAHNKVMIIDGQRVITGSFNFTKSAEHNNAENLLIINDRDLARKYTENWNFHASHSQAYVRGKGGRGYRIPPSYRKRSR